jgi:hypothetical protein
VRLDADENFLVGSQRVDAIILASTFHLSGKVKETIGSSFGTSTVPA